MKLQPNTTAWATIAAEQWRLQAEKGVLWIPDLLQNDAAQAVLLAAHNAVAEGMALALMIDCIGGDDTCVDIAKAIRDPRIAASCAKVNYRALSAGLYLAVACDKRIAVPGAEFLFHGSPYKAGRRTDAEDAEYFEARTGTPSAFWAEKAESGEPFTFGAEEALALGVIHEIMNGDPGHS